MITARAINFAYPKSPEVFSSSLNFHLKSGDKVKIIGWPGAGVSTLLRLLAGSLKPTRGHLECRKRNLLGVLDPISIMRPEFSVLDNIELFCVVYSIPFSRLRSSILASLEEYDVLLTGMALRQLSSSQKKILVALLLMHIKGSVLVIDYWANVKAVPDLHLAMWSKFYENFDLIISTSSAPKSFEPNILLDLSKS